MNFSELAEKVPTTLQLLHDKRRNLKNEELAAQMKGQAYRESRKLFNDVTFKTVGKVLSQAVSPQRLRADPELLIENIYGPKWR